MDKNDSNRRRQYGISMSDLLPSLSRHIGQENSRRNIGLCMNWRRIVGDEFAHRLRPVRIKYDGRRWILLVRCSAGSGLAVTYEERQICERVNGYFGREVISGIKVIGEMAEVKKKVQEEPNWDLYRALKRLSDKI